MNRFTITPDEQCPIKLSILMPALAERMATRLIGMQHDVVKQLVPGVELVVHEDNGEISYGRKMNGLMASARGRHLCCVDDDDRIAGTHVRELLDALDDSNWVPDVVTFHLLRLDLAEVWEFSVHHEDRMCLLSGRLGMRANHLCVWRSDWVKEVSWPDVNEGADVRWYEEMHLRHPHLSEVHVPKVLYVYDYNPSMTKCQHQLSSGQP